MPRGPNRAPGRAVTLYSNSVTALIGASEKNCSERRDVMKPAIGDKGQAIGNVVLFYAISVMYQMYYRVMGINTTYKTN